MSVRRFKAPKVTEKSKLDAVNNELLDELEKLLPADNPVVLKRKKLTQSD